MPQFDPLAHSTPGYDSPVRSASKATNLEATVKCTNTVANRDNRLKDI